MSSHAWKTIAIRLFVLVGLGSSLFVDACAQYRHKPEVEIAAMTPAQRVDEYANEQAYHKYALSDTQREIIARYLHRDGLKSLPRVVQIIDEYEPRRDAGASDHKGEHFDAMAILIADLDSNVVRLRASAEGRQAIDALARAVERMRAAGYGKKDQHEWPQHGRFEVASTYLAQARGINDTDEAVRNSFRYEDKVRLSDSELLAFSNFLVTHHADYPAWSERDFINIEENGKPLPGLVVKNLRPYRDAYQEFKGTKR